MSPNKPVTKTIIDNRDGGYECENCQEKAETLVVTTSNGYMQEILCSECHTLLYPKEEIMLGEGFGNDEG